MSGNEIGIFLAGVAVGALIVVIALRPFVGPLRISAKAERKLVDELLSAEGRQGTGKLVGSSAYVVTQAANAPTIRLTDGSPEISIAGTTYTRIEDVPAEHREQVIDELRLIRDSMPEPIRHQVDALMADQATRSDATST